MQPRKTIPPFYILAISQNRVRLFSCDEREAREVPQVALKIPKSVVEEVGSVEHGPERENTKLRIEEFFRLVDRGLLKALKNGREPLLLAAVDFLVPLYRRANTYPHLFESHVPGNPDRMTARDLHGKAMGILRSPHSA